MKTEKESLLTEVQGIISMSKNLDGHLKKLYSEIQRQRVLLYNADYQIQLLERKVARRMGEKTVEEADYLREVIRNKEKRVAKVRAKYTATQSALKTLEDEGRLVEKRLKTLKKEEEKFKKSLDDINLQNDMTREQLSARIGIKKNLMVRNNDMMLSINKIKQRVLAMNEEVLSLLNE